MTVSAKAGQSQRAGRAGYAGQPARPGHHRRQARAALRPASPRRQHDPHHAGGSAGIVLEICRRLPRPPRVGANPQRPVQARSERHTRVALRSGAGEVGGNGFHAPWLGILAPRHVASRWPFRRCILYFDRGKPSAAHAQLAVCQRPRQASCLFPPSGGPNCGARRSDDDGAG